MRYRHRSIQFIRRRVACLTLTYLTILKLNRYILGCCVLVVRVTHIAQNFVAQIISKISTNQGSSISTNFGVEVFFRLLWFFVCAFAESTAARLANRFDEHIGDKVPNTHARGVESVYQLRGSSEYNHCKSDKHELRQFFIRNSTFISQKVYDGGWLEFERKRQLFSRHLRFCCFISGSIEFWWTHNTLESGFQRDISISAPAACSPPNLSLSTASSRQPELCIWNTQQTQIGVCKLNSL